MASFYMSDGKIYLGYGHPDGYWDRPERKEIEAWAQFGRVLFVNDPQVVHMLRGLFPSFYQNATIALHNLAEN